MRNRNTLEFIGLWEVLNNENFNRVQIETFRNEAGLNRFTMTPQKWIDSTNAIGIISKSGRYGGTYAHYDLAMQFASWISPEFKLYIIQDYTRLKLDENSKLSLAWNLNREISKINYKIHIDAIKDYLLKDLINEQLSYKYASEADMLNVALFNKRAKQWREVKPWLYFQSDERIQYTPARLPFHIHFIYPLQYAFRYGIFSIHIFRKSFFFFKFFPVVRKGILINRFEEVIL